MQGLALTTEQYIEILSLYCTSNKPIIAVAEAPGWEVIGGFPFPTSAEIQLDLFGSVSDESLTLTACLYCVTSGHVGEVAGSRVMITSTIDTRALSSRFQLEGNRNYQVWAQVVGNSGDDYFGYARRIAPQGV